MDSYLQKHQTGLLSQPSRKINLTWIKDLYITPETIKFPELNTGNTFFYTGISKKKKNLDMYLQGRETNENMRLHQIKKLLQRDENHLQK